MANNRLYIYNPVTDEGILIAKGFGNGWNVVLNIEDRLHEFFKTNDLEATDVGGKTELIIKTEY